MTKPHEEEWFIDTRPARLGFAPKGMAPGGTPPGLVPTGNHDADWVLERLVLAHAAPDMVRWMLSQGEPLCKGGEWHLKTCGGACDPECTEYRAALKKAGVIE